MNLKVKLENTISKIVNKLDTSSVAQDENKAKGEKKPFGIMPELVRASGEESIVLLKNDKNTLPYRADTEIAVFGRCQIDYFYVGYGSGGDVNAPYLINPIEGLENCGAKINPELKAYYEKWCAENPVNHGWWGHWPMCYPEPVLDESLVKDAAKRSDTALVIIGRAAGEDRENTLEKGSFYLNDEEKRLLDTVTAYFDSVTVVLDCGNIIDLEWTIKYGDKISALVYGWQGGMESGSSLARVLCGKVNPSGKLADTIAITYNDYPSAKDFGNKDFNNYTEDIYVGYRYFESFCKDRVLYPFGFGLSYTSFEIKPNRLEFDGENVNIKVSVSNTGEVAGKEVVQIYVSAAQGKLSKPALSLVAFQKTKELAPNECQELEFTISAYTFASFDDTGKTGNKLSYILEEGEYKFFAGNSVRNNKLCGSFTLDSDRLLVRLDKICTVQNGFNRIVAKEKDGRLVPETEPVPTSTPYLQKRIVENLPTELGYKKNSYSFNQVKSGEITLDEFITCLTNEELEALTRGQGMMNSPYGVEGNAGAFGGIIDSLQSKDVPAVITTDGPAGIRITQYASLIPCGTALACTWNTPLVEELTTEMGRELKEKGSDVLLAPGMNIHRNVLCGRNFEYFSEDPLLSGKMAAAYVRGIQAHGKSACPKHFACNNQEVNRTKNDSRISQRALREIYLKGFEICVKEAKPLNIMTSYNKINGVWSHYNFDLATTVLRKEWGYTGCVMTDWWMQKSKSPEFPNIRTNAYRVRAQVDVYMPGNHSRVPKPYKSDGTLLETIGTRNGFTRAEMERTAKTVLSLILKLNK